MEGATHKDVPLSLPTTAMAEGTPILCHVPAVSLPWQKGPLPCHCVPTVAEGIPAMAKGTPLLCCVPTVAEETPLHCCPAGQGCALAPKSLLRPAGNLDLSAATN